MIAGALPTGERARRRMVDELVRMGIHDPRVLEAMLAVPRHHFAGPAFARHAYEQRVLPIAGGQTMSRPYTVAKMAELMLEGVPDPKHARVLEIGTGCGYSAAVLCRLFGEVVSIERIRELQNVARMNVFGMQLRNLRLIGGDGMLGVPACAPYDAIAAAAAGTAVPRAWADQLKTGGRIVAPIGDKEQILTVLTKSQDGTLLARSIEPASFVPLLQGVQ